jgi:hypothetical protein
MIYGNYNVLDVFGLLTAFFEWGFLYLLAAKDGVVSYDDILAQYNGSLFYKIVREREAAAAQGYKPVSGEDGDFRGRGDDAYEDDVDAEGEVDEEEEEDDKSA